MSDEITRNDYWAEIHSIGDELASEAASGDNGHDETAREWLFETMHERIDGHQYCIYTWQSQQIIPHSDNDGYSAENFGIESIVSDGQMNWGAIAFGCIYGDVCDYLSRLDEIDGKPFDMNDPCPEPEWPDNTEVWEAPVYLSACCETPHDETYVEACADQPCQTCEKPAEFSEVMGEPDKWFYWFSMPGCLPDSSTYGPFDTEAEAMADAIEVSGE